MDLEGSLGSVLAAGIAARVTPGAAALVIDRDRPIAEVFAGATASADDGGAPVTAQTIFDLASLTKPMATWALAARMIAAGRLSLETRARGVLGDRVDASWSEVTVRHLLGHGAGLPAHRDYYLELRDEPKDVVEGDQQAPTTSGDNASRRERLFERVGAEPLVAEPGAAAVYSDLGYIALAMLLESIDGRRLDEQLAADVLGPLGMAATGFRPIGEVAPADPAHIAPTERDAARGLVIGEVHDENAHVAGGVCGHAGLFGTAADVARFAAAVMSAARGESGGLFDPGVVGELLASSAAPATTWRLGWDTPSPPPARSNAGDWWPRDGVGHLGFTGTSLWLDPPRGRAVALLTNRVYYSRDAVPIRELRRSVMDTACRELFAHEADHR